MTLDEKINLIRQVGEEITTKQELESLIKSKQPMIAYDGFEPSGQIHIAQGLLRAININKMTSAGAKFKMLVADWHAWANHKMGGDLEKIQITGKYFIEVWKACGMDLTNVEFVWASDLVKQEGYWETVMQIAITKNLPRILRTVQIMGREETDTLSASQILYPLMQTADIFMLKANITQLGMDQRKVNMLAREVAKDLGYIKPIVISHHMLLGLLPPTEKIDNENAVDKTIRLKMSKSKPESAIFMTDTKEDIERKIKNAWCKEGEVSENPILEYCKHIVFGKVDTFKIERKPEHGGDLEYKDYQKLENDFANKELHPVDLKIALSKYINEFLEPVRKYFEENQDAKKLKEQVQSFTVTR